MTPFNEREDHHDNHDQIWFKKLFLHEIPTYFRKKYKQIAGPTIVVKDNSIQRNHNQFEL